MARVRQVGGSACAAVAVVAVLVGWLQPSPDLTKADARSFTAHALREIGVRDATVDRRVDAGTYRPRRSSDRIAVWHTRASAPGGNLSLDVDRDRGQAVFVDDVSTDGTERLLTDDQFAALGRLTTDPARHRRVARNMAATIAGLLAASVAVLATTLVPRRLQEMHP
jgi:hypothetical protein